MSAYAIPGVEVLWKAISAVIGAMAAIAIAAWRLSHIWTRMETNQATAIAAIGRIEDTIHGGPGKGNGMKLKLDKMGEDVKRNCDRLGVVEKRLNWKDRRKEPRPQSPGRRKTDKRKAK